MWKGKDLDRFVEYKLDVSLTKDQKHIFID